MLDEKPDLVGAEAVVATLGRWPSFHDAEIMRVHIERDGVSTVAIQLVGPSGSCKDGRVLTFALEGISDLSLAGESVNTQNVISSLLVEKTEGGTRLTFGPCYGLAGRIIADRVSVEVVS